MPGGAGSPRPTVGPGRARYAEVCWTRNTSEVVIDISTVAIDLQRAAVEATPSWVERTVFAFLGPPSGSDVEDRAGLAAALTVDVDRRFGELAATDIDRQRTTPLTIFRSAADRIAEHLQARGVVPPGAAGGVDPYGIHPAHLSDIGPAVHEAGMVWGAAKAAVHLARRRDEGLL